MPGPLEFHFGLDNQRDLQLIEQPTTGYVPWPLDQDEIATVVGYFNFADQQLNGSVPFDPSHLFNDTDFIKVLRYKMSNILTIQKILGVIFIEANPAAFPVTAVFFFGSFVFLGFAFSFLLSLFFFC